VGDACDQELALRGGGACLGCHQPRDLPVPGQALVLLLGLWGWSRRRLDQGDPPC